MASAAIASDAIASDAIASNAIASSTIACNALALDDILFRILEFLIDNATAVNDCLQACGNGSEFRWADQLWRLAFFSKYGEFMGLPRAQRYLGAFPLRVPGKWDAPLTCDNTFYQPWSWKNKLKLKNSIENSVQQGIFEKRIQITVASPAEIIHSVKFGFKGNLVFAARHSGSIDMYHSDSGNLHRHFGGNSGDACLSLVHNCHEIPYPDIEESPWNGSLGQTSPIIYGGYASGKIGLFSIFESEPLDHFQAHSSSVTALKLPLGNPCELFSGGADGVLKQWKFDEARISCFGIANSFGQRIFALESHADTGLLFAAGQDRVVRGYDARILGAPVLTLPTLGDWIMSISEGLVSGSPYLLTSDKVISTWDLRKTAIPVSVAQRTHRSLITGFRVEPKRLVSVSMDGSVAVSTSHTAAAHRIFDIHDDWILGVDMEESELVVGTAAGTIGIYQLISPAITSEENPLLGRS